ncbi:DNA-binding response regulator [Alteromonas aestuariivivens]|uniref:DNA-binding response regulator n=1 Tax=Alteromonas aestuariivivens TaxID=1938339 RepID=A0A3D8M4M6_9ALTE|nr:response regulator transcription factor [Alteromonas aestuariivivens]RDV24591.1 DNA-binding response regulator [Alteromonas aestuariivivens]
MQSKVLIADDHPLFRAAMRQALSELVGNAILEASSYEEARSCLEQHDDIDLVFLDIRMPGNEGLTGLGEIRSRFPDVLVVMVSAEDAPALISRAMDLGCSGFIPKSTPLPVILEAVQKVLDGDRWLPDDYDAAAGGVQDEQQQAFAEGLAQLTPHQFNVLKMLADGLLNKQIAYELDISESTVKQHVSAVLKKLQVNNRTQAGIIFRQMMDVGQP